MGSNIKHCELSIQENMAIFSQGSLCMYWFLVEIFYWVLLSCISYQLMLSVLHTNLGWHTYYTLNTKTSFGQKWLKSTIMNFWCIQHASWILGINFSCFNLIANWCETWYWQPTWFRQLDKLNIHNSRIVEQSM